jgi:DNA helicase-2/ATP-dependent DNA helicase PcrA
MLNLLKIKQKFRFDGINKLEEKEILDQASKAFSDVKLFDQLNNDINYIQNVDNSFIMKNKINLMTMHSSKGLEFSVVFILDSSKFLGKNIQDERRLFYVAITRAQQVLYLTSVNSFHKKDQNFIAAAAKSRYVEVLKDKYEGQRELKLQKIKARKAQIGFL